MKCECKNSTVIKCDSLSNRIELLSVAKVVF